MILGDSARGLLVPWLAQLASRRPLACLWGSLSHAGPRLRVGLPQFQWRNASSSDAKVEHFDKHGEGHGEVDIAFGHVHIEAISHQYYTDEHEKTERQHLDRRMAIDKGADGSRKQHHKSGGDDDRSNHDS